MALTPKQEKFWQEYLEDFNATEAAIRAGYSKKTAYSQGQRLLKNVEIRHRLAQHRKKMEERTEVTAERVILEFARIGFLNPTKFFTMVDDNVILDFNGAGEDEFRAIQSIEQEMYVEKDGTDVGQTVKKTKLRFYNKQPALDSLAKHTGAYERDEDREREELKKVITEVIENVDTMTPEERRARLQLLKSKRAG